MHIIGHLYNVVGCFYVLYLNFAVVFHKVPEYFCSFNGLTSILSPFKWIRMAMVAIAMHNVNGLVDSSQTIDA